MRRESEKTLERRLARAVEEMGGECVKLTSQYHRGLPDRLCLLPGGRASFIELKSTGSKPTRLQESEHARLRRLGFRVRTVDTTEGLEAFITEMRRGGDA